ncbi:hypothetical protein [Planctomycetes bacterium Poly30]
MTTRTSKALALSAAAALASTASFGQTLISDGFELGSAADYTVVDDGTPDGAEDFSFDYIAAGIPLAPRSGAGDTNGLRLTANVSAGVADARTAFHNTAITASRYRLTVDVWMNFVGTAGTTEFGHVGVGGDGTTFNSVFTPISGSGAFLSFTGDGGSGSDYRWFRDSANTPLGDADSTTLPNTHPSYLGHGSNNSGAFFQALFPSPPSTIAGSPGNIWTTVEIEVDNNCGLISFSFDGQLTFRGSFAGTFDGLVSLGIADAFSSVGTADQFTLFDNLLVEELPPLGTAYCTVITNSTGLGALLLATGDDAVAGNDLTLCAQDLPTDTFGIFLASPTSDFVTGAGGSVGNLCIGPAIGRGVGGAILNSGPGGTFSITADLTALPTSAGPAAVMAGDTVFFQGWFRDFVGGSTTSNYTNGLIVTFN